MNVSQTGHAARNDLLATSWVYDEIAEKRRRYLSPSLATFTAYAKPILLSRGEGQYLWDAEGKRYLDCLAQNLCISVGYNHPLVTAEATRQLQALQHCTTMYYHPVPVHFAEELVSHMPPGQDWVVHLVNSGAEAIDLAMLMARAFTERYELLALRSSFHGLHYGAMSATGLAMCHQPVPPMGGIVHVHNPDQFHGVYGPGLDPYLTEIDRVIETSTSGAIAGFLVEPIQGYGGVIPLPEGYLAGAFARVRAAGGVCIVDEVQTGFGRTGDHYWGFEAEPVVPDIVVMAKGIGNGFPLAAVVVRREIATAMAERKFFNTYGSNPTSCAAGRAVLRAIKDERLQENAAKVGGYVRDGLLRLREKHGLIGDVRGRGLMLGIEINQDRVGKKPALAEAIRVHQLMREGGIISGLGGTLKNVLRINPPLCVTRADADFLLEVVDKSFAQV